MLAMQQNRSKLFYAILSLPATSFGFALSVQIAALSWILTTKYGLDIHDIGLVWAAGPLAGIFGQVIIGGLSDRVWLWNGRRRPFIVIGGVMAALALLALPSLDIISASLGLDGVLGVALVVVLTLMVATGLVALSAVLHASLLLPVFMLSAWVGGRYFQNSSEKLYRRVALCLLFCVAVFGILR